MESYGSEFRRRYSQGSAVFFASGVSFLVSGIFSYTGIFAKDGENSANEYACIEDAADIPEVSPELKRKRRKGGVAFAFGIFLILSAPLWYMKDFEIMLLTVIIAGAVLMAYGLFLMASCGEK
jgi:hypothetical protein